MTTETPGSAPAGNPPAGAAAPWFGADAPSEIKGFVELKGWDSPVKAIDSYRNLETLLGADKAGRAVVWPKDANDTEGWKAIHAKLGVPETPDAYGLKPAEGQTDDFLKAAAPVLHKLGLSKAQAEGLNQFLTEYTGGQQKAMVEQIAAKTTEQLNAVKTEWGAAYEQNVALGQRAAKALGMDEKGLEQLEAAMGTAGLMQFMHKVGALLGEDQFVEGGPPQRQYTPDAAKARLEQLMLDKEWLNRYANGDVAAVEEKRKLDLAMLSRAA